LIFIMYSSYLLVREWWELDCLIYEQRTNRVSCRLSLSPFGHVVVGVGPTTTLDSRDLPLWLKRFSILFTSNPSRHQSFETFSVGSHFVSPQISTNALKLGTLSGCTPYLPAAKMSSSIIIFNILVLCQKDLRCFS
jgi:hypothetical protein